MAVHYKLKAIKFLGRDVPIVVQNENGPCPLIALANVLLLRNQIQLSVDCPEVSQERLLALIAGFLLDSNNPERLGSANAEMQANLQKNMGDAVEMLPKLTTGLDVNLFYHDIRGFEFTDVVAIFDLLDINLVHGWLVDPQDKETVACIGKRSYNALIERLVALAGPSDADTAAARNSSAVAAAPTAPEPAPGPTDPASSNAAQHTRAAESSTGLAPKEASPAAQEITEKAGKEKNVDLLGAEYDADLQAALHLSLSQPAAEAPSKPQDMQQPQPMATDMPPQSAVVSAPAKIAPHSVQNKPAEPESVQEGNAPVDAVAMAEDYVVISHPKLDAEMTEQAAAEDAPVAAAKPAHEPEHGANPAADGDDALQGSQAQSAAEPEPALQKPAEKVSGDAAAPEQAPGAAELAAMLASCGLGAVAGSAAGGNAAEASSARAAAPAAERVAGAADNAVGDGAAEPEQAAPAGGAAAQQVASAEGPAAKEAAAGGPVPEQAPAMHGDAYVIQAFLDNTSSQLTEHGLVSLHAGLKPNQLAVLFRNNHFNTLFKFKDALYILVTDLGYLHERDVVWEKLDAIDGDTVFVTSTLKPPEPVDVRTVTEQANADYALALQLHKEEQEAAERRRLAAAADGAAADGGRPGAAPQLLPGRPGQPGPSGPPQQNGNHLRHRHGRHHRPPHSGPRPSRPKQDCTIM